MAKNPTGGDTRSSAAPTTAPETGTTGSTDDTADAAGVTLAAGAVPHRPDVVRLVDADGKDVDLGSVYDDQGAATIVTITGRVYEEFTYPGTSTTGKRLLYHPGQMVPRAELEERTARLSASRAG